MKAEAPRPRPPVSTVALTALGFLLLYIPLVVLVAYSFLKPTDSGIMGPSAWTFEWYEKVFDDHSLGNALGISLWVGFWTMLCSTLLGTMAALALERTKIPGKKFVDFLIFLPLITPEIVLGLSLLIWLVFLKVTLGTFSIILAHITFSVSYVIITVRTRLHGFDRSLDEAALDLGATPWQTFWRVTFPLIWPGVFSGALLAFTLSFDDFLITFFTAGVGSDTLPLKLYSMIRFGMGREVNALSTLILGATLVLVVLFSSQGREKTE